MWQISLSGTGGQGIILAGIILAEAAMLENKQAIQTQSYGPEARGGASKSEVIISDEAIDYPKIVTADILLVMSQDACNKYIGMLKPGGQLIVDTSIVTEIPDVEAEIFPVAITKAAREEIGNVMFANLTALGVLVGVSGIVSRESLTKAVLGRVPKGTEAINQKALELGFRLGDNTK
ncbi:MAG: 2-oxoacid:acceptor oxidoreductase family protein [Negativicutes bacterium]|nr:2-oxoacid:acceptor oxidoreductase family protein [Negativicutes bacterium]